MSLQLAEIGHRLNGLDAKRESRSRGRLRRYWPWMLLGAVLIAAEVVIPLILISGN